MNTHRALFAVVCTMCAASLISACSSVKTVQPELPLQSRSAVDLYQQLCSSCHGVEGRGDGPVAPLIKIPVPDLTRLAARNGGEFPTEAAQMVVDGRFDRRAHGSRDMPVWGWQLYYSPADNDEAERARTQAVIDRLVAYLASIQRP